jgi:hypothetical protein
MKLLVRWPAQDWHDPGPQREAASADVFDDRVISVQRSLQDSGTLAFHLQALPSTFDQAAM